MLVSSICIHLRLGFPLHQVPSVSVCLSHRVDQLSFAISVTAVSGSSFTSPLPPTCFIISRLFHPRRRHCPSFAAAFISTIFHCWLIFTSSPELYLAVLLRRRLHRRRSPSLVFYLLCHRFHLWLPITPVLLSPLLSLGDGYHRSPFRLISLPPPLSR